MRRAIACTCVCLGLAGQAAAQTMATVTQTATVRLQPTEQSNAIETLPAGMQVEVVPTTTDVPEWRKVRLPGIFPRTGYVPVRTLAAAAPPAAAVPAPVAPAPAVSTPTPVPPPAAPAPAIVVAPARTAPVASTPPAPAPAPSRPEPPVEPRVSAPTPDAPKPAPATVSEGHAVAPATVLTSSREPASIDVEEALARGRKLRGGVAGLVLSDVAQGFAAAINAANGSIAGTSSGFSLRVYTPQTWAEQLVSEAAKEYREVDADMFSPEDLAPVLRVRVYPDTPTYVSAAGVAGTSSVRHVVIRDAQRKAVLQPMRTETWSDEVSNAMGGRKTYVGLEATFDLDGLKRLRGDDQEFFITVIGTTGEEKDFKVKRKHFDKLPIR